MESNEAGGELMIPDNVNYHDFGETGNHPNNHPNNALNLSTFANLIHGLSIEELISLRELLNFVLKNPETPQRGHIEAKHRKRGDKVYGPYLYLRWKEDGKYRSKYLGKARVA